MIKIVSDSSSDIFNYPDVDYAAVPLKVRTSKKEYVDTSTDEVLDMCEFLATHNEKTSTSCPNAHEWLEAFNKEDDNICFTISSNLSGSFNSCLQAKQIFEEEYGHKVVIIDSFSAGSELKLLIDKAAELIKQGKTIDEIEKEVDAYSDTTHVYFYTPSVNNLANNGRIPSLVSKAISVLKISLVGMGTYEGRIKMIHESRTPKKAIDFIIDKMIERGYKGGKVIADGCDNVTLYQYLETKIKEKFPEAQVEYHETGILCSYYVEYKGIIIAFEGAEEHE